MQLYLIKDTTSSMANKLVNEKGLILYANKAHFINECGKAETIEDAIEILKTDLFTVEIITINNDAFIYNLI